MLEVFGNCCAYCGSEEPLTIDHFNPLARNGRHAVSNVVAACAFCNSSKNDSDPFEWMESRGIDGDFVVAAICETRAAA